MKLQCPHCGVKGSTEDSYSGRKVKCPKCQALFEVKPDMALEVPEETTLLSGLSSTSTESPSSLGEVEIPITADEGLGEPVVDEAISVEEFERSVELMGGLTEPELESTPLLKEETLDWADIASEVDLQLTDDELGEEDDEAVQGGSAELSSLKDEFEKPVGDIGLTLEEESEIGDESESGFWDEVEENPAEIDLQLTDGILDEEDDEAAQDGSAELSSLKDEFETPAGDIGLTLEEESEIADESDAVLWDEVEENPEEIEPTELMEESPLLDPVDSLSPEQEIANDLAEPAVIAENSGEGDSWDEVQLVEEADEIELEPYGIDQEQCWQCGKKGSLGEPFVEKDGRLYCTDCAPIEALEEAADTSQNQDEADPLYAQGLGAGAPGVMDDATKGSTNKFAIGAAIREAWAKTKGAKGAVWAGSAIMYLVILVIAAGGALLLPAVGSDLTNVTGLVSNILFPAVTNIFSVLFTAGLLFLGIRKVAGDVISWKMTFKGFSCAGKLIVAAILQFILVSIGFLFLILPGIYLIVGYAMTLPLIVDKGLSPWQAMEMSRKAVHKIWWKVAGLFIVMGFIFVVSLLPLGIGLIWTWPMFFILAGVVYHYLFGDEKKAS